MSIQHVIDGEDPLFDFEGFGIPAHSPTTREEVFQAQLQLVDMSQIPVFSPLELAAYAATSTNAELAGFLTNGSELGHYDYRAEEEEEEDSFNNFKGKGKAVSSPMNIAPRDLESHFDLFTFAPGSSESSRGTPPSEPSSSTSTTPQSVASFSFSPGATPGSIASSYTTNVTTPSSYLAGGRQAGEEGPFDGGEETGSAKGKGKSRAHEQQQDDSLPSLPPLRFHPTSLAGGETPWPAEEHASPSFLTLTSSSSLSRTVISDASPAAALQADDSTSHTPTFIHRVPSRTHSFSSLPSMSTRSMSRIKLSFGKKKSTSNLARKLLLCNDTPCEGGVEDVIPPPKPVTPFFRSDQRTHWASNSALVTPTFTPSPELQRSRSFRERRQKANPDVDAAADCEGEIADPSPEINHFDTFLPREIKLHIFKALLVLHEREGEHLCTLPDWTYAKSVNRKNHWIGRDAGFIELVRMSRVSKAWQQLVFDGQLWVTLDISSFPMVPTHLIMRLAQSSGSFVRSVDFTGHTRLSASSFLDITNSFCISNALSEGHSSGTTQLTSINLTGCTAISTHALNDILSHSPLLSNLNLKGLHAVTNSTLRALADHCPCISSIDISRCCQMDAEGLITFLSRPHPLRELHASGLRRLNDYAMGLIGKHAPDLEVLDVGNSHLHNSGLEALVSVGEDEDLSRTVLLTSREAGRDPGDPTKYRRRVTKLRHLTLSYCALLSDGACSNLAHSVPKLEFLELAGIGTELKDDGLVRLLATTPLIRRLDLEENSDVTDAVVFALTPHIPEGRTEASSAPPQPEPGSMLEQLSMSYALHLTNDALLGLVRACPRLKTLELDNTRVNGLVVKEFVRLARKRGLKGAEMVAIDCRSVNEGVMKDLAPTIRTRKGWRAWDARNLRFLDSRDEEGLGVGYDECDDARVTLKTFYSWQSVDAVEAAREKRRKANKKAGRDGNGDDEYIWTKRGTSKWWSPSGRRFTGSISPVNGGDSCIIM